MTRRHFKKSITVSPRITDAMVLKSAVLDEKDAQVIEIITSDLIGQDNLDSLLVLKLISAFQTTGVRENLYFLAENKDCLKERFLSSRHRRIFISMPSVTKSISSYLSNLGLSQNQAALSSEVVFQLEEYLTQTEVFHNYIGSTLEEASVFPIEDLAEIQVLEPNTRANLIIFQVFNRTFVFLVRERVSLTLERFQEFLKTFAIGQLADWKPEYLVLGAVGLRKYNDVFVIGSPEICVDPIFIECNKNISERLMMTFLRSKYRLIQSLLKRELSEVQFHLQIS